MGKKTRLITLTNKNGMEACIANYGARVVSHYAFPTRTGSLPMSCLALTTHGHVAYTFSIRQK